MREYVKCRWEELTSAQQRQCRHWARNELVDETWASVSQVAKAYEIVVDYVDGAITLEELRTAREVL